VAHSAWAQARLEGSTLSASDVIRYALTSASQGARLSEPSRRSKVTGRPPHYFPLEVR